LKFIIDMLNFKIYNDFQNRLLKGQSRSIIAKKNIFGSFGIKGANILVSLYLVPLTITMLNKDLYGVWITLFSIVSWFNIMDIGLGNGFRNKYAEAIAINDLSYAKKLTSTFYITMFFIVLGFIVIYSIVHQFIDWYKILNVDKNTDVNLNLVVLNVFVFLGIQLLTKNINMVLLAMQKTALSNLLPFLGNIISLLGILLLSFLGVANLFSISLVFMLAPIIVFVFTTIFLFKTTLSKYKPDKIEFNSEHLKDMLGIGLKFFIIQLSMIFIYSSANIVITQLFGPGEVTNYNIAYRLFTSFQIFFTIIVTPFWSAFTDANCKGDYVWIRKTIRVLVLIWLLFVLFLFIVWLLTPYIIKFWIGDSVFVTYSLSFQFFLFTAFFTFSSIMSSYLAGVGKITLSLFIAIIQSVINIPLAVILGKYFGLGINGVILSLNIGMLLPCLLLTIQTYKLINHKGHGIWNK